MNNEKELPKRKATRLTGFDYNTNGAYFITICTQDRRKLLSRVVGDDVLGVPKSVELLPHGKIADKYINQLNDFYDNVKVEGYVIMPNHIHAIISIDFELRTHEPCVPTYSLLSRVVAGFKRSVTIFANENRIEFGWQSRFYDHIIRDAKDRNEIANYIEDNITRWELHM